MKQAPSSPSFEKIEFKVFQSILIQTVASILAYAFKYGTGHANAEWEEYGFSLEHRRDKYCLTGPLDDVVDPIKASCQPWVLELLYSVLDFGSFRIAEYA